MKNIKLKENFAQVAVWPATVVGKEESKEFESFFLETLGTRIQYLEEILTKPDTEDTSEETGGRNDVFFAVHSDDISKFAVKRLSFGIRWIEDATSETNGYSRNPIYPERVLEYCSWNEEEVKKVSLNLVGIDGNAYSILGSFSKQAKKENWTEEEIESVLTEAKSGDYSHLVSVISKHCSL